MAEKNCEYSGLGYSRLAAPSRLQECERGFEKCKIRPKNVLDAGGTTATATWLSKIFPHARITIQNNSPYEKEHLPPGVDFDQFDVQKFIPEKKYDLIFAGELIEHLWNPDGFIESCAHALVERGWLLITTPNLSCLHNRIFLALGWTPGNISPSIRYIVGNPMLPEGSGQLGSIGSHKSVFTYKGLKRLLRLYGFKFCYMRGYSYVPANRKFQPALKGRTVASSGYRFRHLINKAMPHSWREGMALFVQYQSGSRRVPPLEYPPDIPFPVFTFSKKKIRGG